MFQNIWKYLWVIVFLFFYIQSAQASDDPLTSNGESQDQEAFPFDKPCLSYDKSNFQIGQALLDVMKTGDFPQYCTLYSLSDYQVKQKRDEGYFLLGVSSDPSHVETTRVFLKSQKVYQPNQLLAGKAASASNPSGQWAYFVGGERFVMENGDEKEYYVFQEIDF